MIRVDVADKTAAELKDLALRDDRTLEEVVAEAFLTYLSFRYHDPELSGAQLTRLEQSKDQADRSEFVSQEEVEAFFDDWEKEATAR